MMRKNKNSKILKSVFPILMCLIITVLLVYFIGQLYNAESYFKNEAKVIAEDYTVQCAQAVEDSVSASFTGISSIAAGVTSVHGYDALDAYGKQQADKYSISCLQFLHEGIAEYRFGEFVGSSTADEVVELVSSGKFGCSRIYKDPALGVPSVAVYSPVIGNDEVDGVIAYFAVSNTILNRAELNEHVLYYCLAEAGGSIMESYSAEGFKTDVSHNVYTYLFNLCNSKDTVDRIQLNTSKRISDTYYLSIDMEEYVVSSILVDTFGTDCFVFSVYSVDNLLLNRYTTYDKLISAALGMFVITIVVMIAFIVIKRKSDSQLAIMDENDPILGCNTYSKFMREATEILSQNRFSKYAVIYTDINKFSYIKEHFDAQMSEETLRYVSNIIKKTTTANETYGHVMDDRFVRLMHFSDMQELNDRIRLMHALASNYGPMKDKDYTLKMAVGVYVIDRDKDTEIESMIERATIAQKMNKKVTDKPFIVFDSAIRTDYLKEAEIEAKMDTALANREFKVFYQPKYNISKDSIDGAEALVRWYDEKVNAYVGPDLFVPLFEVNGFISRLDRYVFTEVCKYLDESAKRGEKVVPISVNVSRVSATQPDFLSFYIKIKRDYNIPDNFMTLEFTESFAYENVETIGKIVSTLKNSGFMCSIDDFGSGYSSFSVLKELQMDELKLDKFFLKPGTDSAKDETLLQTVITLGKSFGMKVTQEGVEGLEELRHLEQMGCEVIQGYYYSKPLPLSDFMDFVARDTSLKGVTYKRASINAAKQSV